MWDEEGVIKFVCFIIDFKVKNIYIFEEMNNKFNSRNVVIMINLVVDFKKKYKKEIVF